MLRLFHCDDHFSFIPSANTPTLAAANSLAFGSRLAFEDSPIASHHKTERSQNDRTP